MCVHVCVCMEGDEKWKIPKFGVIHGLRLFLSAISLTLNACLPTQALSPLVLLWVSALDSWGLSGDVHVHSLASDL